MTQSKIYPIIVTYRSELKDCNTYISLSAKLADIRFLVYDNSPRQINRKYESYQVDYFGDGMNRGVSAAYNYGCQRAEDLGYEYVLLLDEDTHFDKDFIERLAMAIEKNGDIDIFAPSISYQGGLPFSPSRCSLFKTYGVSLPPCHRYSLKKYMPVNSGTCIRIGTFKKAGGYNEAIRLDFADFDFFQRTLPFASYFMLIDSIAHQDFSNEETDVCKLENRYKIYLEGALATSFSNRFVLQVIRHTLALTVRTRRMVFIKTFFKQYIFNKR